MALTKPQNCYFPLSIPRHFAFTPESAKKLKNTLLSDQRLSVENFNKGLEVCEDLNIKKIDLITAQCYRNLSNFKRNYSHKTPIESSEKFVLTELYKIIPNIYFGSSRNRTQFNKIVKRILTQSYGECVHLSFLIQGFNLDSVPWLDCYPDSIKSTKLMSTNILLMQTIVKPLINYCWYFEKDIRTTEAWLVPRSQNDSFCDQNLNLAIRHGLLEHVNDIQSKDVLGRLLFTKKGPEGLDYRPILCQSYRGKNNYLRKKLAAVINSYQIGNEQDLYKKWDSFVEFNLNKSAYCGHQKTFYGVKLDLLDAFGLVELEQLKNIISNINPQLLTTNDKKSLNRIIDKQYVFVRGKKVYSWKKGLLQGAQLSPLLCDLYLSHTYYNFFKHFNQPHSFMHRKMDDVFFVSTNKNQVFEFESQASKVWLINEKKTRQYTVPDIDESKIVFCGKIFDLATLQTSSAFEGQSGEKVNVTKKFKIWNFNKQYDTGEVSKFFKDFMKFEALNFYFSAFEVNTKYNYIDTVVKNIFDGMIFAAFKLFTAVESVNYLFKKKEETAVIYDAIHEVVNLFSLKIHSFLMRYKGSNYHDFLNVKAIKFISFKAFILVFKKSSKYSSVVESMKNHIRRQLKVRKLPLVVELKYFGCMPKCFLNYNTKRTLIFRNRLASKIIKE